MIVDEGEARFTKFRKLFPTGLKLFSNLKVCLIGQWSINLTCFLADTPQEVYDALNKLGFDSFRCGQEEAIMQILSGKTVYSCIS